MNENDFETLRKNIENLIENDKSFSDLQMSIESDKTSEDAKVTTYKLILTPKNYIIYEVNKITLLATAYGAYQYVRMMDGKIQFVIFCWI